ncbi:MAG: hypothetical protein ACRDU9_05585 [Acidimicrobiia bacterium]
MKGATAIAAALLATLGLGLAGCTTTVSGESFELAEFSISGPATLAAGTGSISVANSGVFPHTLVVTKTDGAVVAATGLIQPGGTTSLALELEAGTFSFTCRIVTENDEGRLVDHFEAGMHTTVRVSQ